MELTDVQKAQALSAVRTLLAFGAGILVARGKLSAADASQLVDAAMQIGGLVVVAVPLVWGMVNKRNVDATTKQKEVTALNVGIEISNRDSAITPPVPPAAAHAVIEKFGPSVEQPPEETKP